MSTPREDRLPPFCTGCRYSLNGLPRGNCPECGRPFDPSDRTTVAWEYRKYRRRGIFTHHRGTAAMVAGSAAVILVSDGGHSLPLPLPAWLPIALAESWNRIVAADSSFNSEMIAIGYLSGIGFLWLGVSMAFRPGRAAIASLAVGMCAMIAAVGVAVRFSDNPFPVYTGIPFVGACGYTVSRALRSLRRDHTP